MSFLNNLLSSIGGAEQGKAPATSASRPGLQSPVNGSSSSSARPVISAPPPSLKRKGEPLLGPSPAKLPRIESPISRPGAPALPSHPKPNVNRVVTPPTAAASRPAVKPNNGSTSTNRPAVPSTLKSSNTSTNTKPVTAQPTINNRPVVSAATANAPLKRGTYVEILARAQAAKVAQADFGQIKHKPVPKLSRKERLAQEAEAAERAKQEARQGKSFKRDARPELGSRGASKSGEQVKEKKKPVDLGYKGTMRPAPAEPAYKGTMKSAPSAQTGGRLPYKSLPKPPPDRSESAGRYKYASYSDEEDEEEEEDSDDESDMEAAGFDELQEEEQQSLRAAKKEDEEALRQENAMKLAKLEKKRKLEELVARQTKRR